MTRRRFASLALVLIVLMSFCMPVAGVFAGSCEGTNLTGNPCTGDTSGKTLQLMLILLGVSVVLIAALVIFSVIKKKKR